MEKVVEVGRELPGFTTLDALACEGPHRGERLDLRGHLRPANDAPWGKWTATKKVAPTQWTADGDFADADMAAFNVAVPSGYTSLTAAVGALGYRFGAGSDFSDVIDSGFPGEGYKRTDMDGFKQFYCTGNAEDASDWNPLDDRVKVDRDMGKGASGGPIATTEAQIISANSHYETEDDGVTRKNDDLFGDQEGAAWPRATTSGFGPVWRTRSRRLHPGRRRHLVRRRLHRPAPHHSFLRWAMQSKHMPTVTILIARMLGYNDEITARLAEEAGGTWKRYAPGDHAR
ncbi:hypothetical protein [Streptomyces sp. NPDC001292]|uniref:hypothetical protein n=1 Tax=Streptomyces sp. NPDC001292 TaxID=3364558 RepID=UPI0036CA132B